MRLCEIKEQNSKCRCVILTFLSISKMNTEVSTLQNSTVKDEPSLGLTSPLRFFLLAVLILLLIVGVVGNVLTLVALPYVRRKYGAQFSALKSTTFILLLHLSLCDLLYIRFGFTHFIHVLIVGNVIDCYNNDILLKDM